MVLVQTTSDIITKHLIPYIVLVCGDGMTLVQSTFKILPNTFKIPYIVLVCGDRMTFVQSTFKILPNT